MSSRLRPAWQIADRLRTRTEIPVVLCIDVEPDPRVFDRSNPPPWLGFERLIEETPALRARLEEATGAPAHFTWFLRMDPQVADTWGTATWAADTYREALDGLADAGDEFGLHSHTWRWDAELDEWVADYEDQSWAENCVAVGLDAFEEGLGRPCGAHRAGDHFLSPSMLSVLSDCGVRVDLSVEPGIGALNGLGIDGERARGQIPDYRGVPTRPYRTTPAAFPGPEASGGDPLLIPLLTAPARKPPFRRLPLSPVQPFSVFAPRLAAELLRGPPVIAVAIRTDSVLCHDWDQIQENLLHLAERRGMVFETAGAVAER